MKRLWFAFCLVLLVIISAGFGIYRNATLKLQRAVEQLQAALPPHTTLTYRSAAPSFLVGGITLRDVTFRNGHKTFRARFIRLGRPRFMHGGQVTLSSLVLKDMGYTTSKLRLDIHETTFRHLIIPAEPGQLDTDLTASSMKSLATLLAFNPEDLTSLRFALTQVKGLKLQFTAPIETPYRNLTIRNAQTDFMTLEGYGQGKRIYGALKNFSLGINISKDNLNTFGTTLASVLLAPEEANSTTPLPATLAFSSIEGKEGVTHLLQHPFKGNSKVTEEFWKRPLDLPWSSTGTITVNGMKLAFNKGSAHNSAALDYLYLARRNENKNQRTEIFSKGFHIRPSRKIELPFPVHGGEGTLRATLISHHEEKLWQSDATAHLSLNKIGNVTLNTHYNFPYDNPFYQSPEILHNFANALEFNSVTLAVHGDHFVDFGLALAKQISPGLQQDKLLEKTISDLMNLSEKRPLVAPLADYVANPHDRTLDISLGTLSSAILSSLPLNAPAETILDALHVTSISTH